MAPKGSDCKFTGSHAVVKAVLDQGVDTVFGIIGGVTVGLYDVIYDSKLRHIIVGHEQGAAHMAEGYARVTGRPGVVISTSGPGATNLVTGLADAFMDSTPLIAITGQVSVNLIGNDAFQEADMRGITMPITKHNYQVTNPDALNEVFAEAFYVALTGRPGPVLIDLPKDVSMAVCGQHNPTPHVPIGYKPPFKGHPMQIQRALEKLRAAKKPVILAGGGVIHAGASGPLKRLADACGAPVSCSLMGLGAFPGDHPRFLGMPGMHGTGYANLAINECDCLLVVGSRLDDRITGRLDAFSPHSTLIHIDVDASEIGKNLTCQVPIVGDANPVLKALAEGAEAWETKPDLTAWYERIAQWKKDYPLRYEQKDGEIAPQAVVELLGQMLDEDAIVATGVGQHQMYVCQWYPFRKPRTLLTSGGLGTMGFGLPASIGAKLGKPDTPVVLVDGDGSFLMNIQELVTAVRYQIPVVCLVLNNAYLGMVRQWQELFFDKRQSETELTPPPYDKVAQAFGALGRRVEKASELRGAIDWALNEAQAQKKPVVLDIQVEREALVLPMVPAGAANVDFIPCPGSKPRS